MRCGLWLAAAAAGLPPHGALSVGSSKGYTVMLGVAADPRSTEKANVRSTAYSATISLVSATIVPVASTYERIKSYLFGSDPATSACLTSHVESWAGSTSVVAAADVISH